MWHNGRRSSTQESFDWQCYMLRYALPSVRNIISKYNATAE
jgi:hypothetical protein